MSGLQHCDQNGKGNCSKTFWRLVLTHLNFSTTTEASRFQCTNLSIPAKGEENNLHLLTGWCETNSGWKELVLLYSWTVTTLHGDPLLVPTVKPCFLSGDHPGDTDLPGSPSRAPRQRLKFCSSPVITLALLLFCLSEDRVKLLKIRRRKESCSSKERDSLLTNKQARDPADLDREVGTAKRSKQRNQGRSCKQWREIETKRRGGTGR